MADYIQVSKSWICLISNGQKFYVGSKHFDALIKAIETAKTMPEGSLITLKVEVTEETEEEEEIAEGEEEPF
ncbi:MAG: hypothetical protein KIH10_16380 [Candidatus Freyarchaeota archaeon]|nr:hypothetical protein [Candidatus Jordarchaeia archaeon]MBS7281137.1 hypothetical protein [Candidatus Jordarchaeia archaeon]